MNNGRIVGRDPGSTDRPSFVSDGAGGLLAAWTEQSTPFHGIIAQRIERGGHWGYPAPRLVAALDAPGDQGGFARLSWDASRLDPWPGEGLHAYSLWRALPVQPRGMEVGANWRAEALNGERREPVFRREDSRDRTVYALVSVGVLQRGRLESKTSTGRIAQLAGYVCNTPACTALRLRYRF